MVYSDVKNYGLIGILPDKKRYGTKKDIAITTDAIKKNKAFIQFVLEGKKAEYLNEILGGLVEWVIKRNEVFYKYELKREKQQVAAGAVPGFDSPGLFF